MRFLYDFYQSASVSISSRLGYGQLPDYVRDQVIRALVDTVYCSDGEIALPEYAEQHLYLLSSAAISPITKTGEKAAVGSAIGLEFQILDDLRHPDAKLGTNGDRTIGSLYDLIPAPKDKKVLPVGEWNHARILSQGKHVTFWLNGEQTVTFERGSAAFRAAVAASKFKDIPDFGEWADGHILLQEHGNEASFRNVKLRELPTN